MCRKIIGKILLPVIALVFVFSFAETALGRSLDYNAFLESLNANGFEFEESGFYAGSGGRVVYVGDERLIIFGQGVWPLDVPVAVQITWAAEVTWLSSTLRVIYVGDDEEIIAFLNETFRPANDTILTVTIDGVPINFPDQAPVIANGRTLVPVRSVFEKLGYHVGWDERTNTVTLRRIRSISGESPDMLMRVTEEVFITIGSDVFQFDSTLNYTYENHALDVPAQIINGRTMLPIRAILECFGYSVEWNEATQTILVTSNVTSYEHHWGDDFNEPSSLYYRNQINDTVSDADVLLANLVELRRALSNLQEGEGMLASEMVAMGVPQKILDTLWVNHDILVNAAPGELIPVYLLLSGGGDEEFNRVFREYFSDTPGAVRRDAIEQVNEAIANAFIEKYVHPRHEVLFFGWSGNIISIIIEATALEILVFAQNENIIAIALYDVNTPPEPAGPRGVLWD